MKFDSLEEKTRQFYLLASILPIEGDKNTKMRSFWPILRAKHFFQKTLKISAPNSFFQNEPKFFYLILDFFNKFLMTWNWTIWRKKRGDWSLKIEFEECSLKIDFEECSLKIEFKESSLKIEGWRAKFEDWIWRKASFFRVGRGAQVGNLHLEVNSGASVDIGRIFCHGALQPLESHQPSIWKKAKHFMIQYAKQDSETTTLLAAVRCCVTATLVA